MNKKIWLVTLVAFALRLLLNTLSPMWYDEAFTLVVARLPLDRMMAAIAGDVHPPLYYLIVWAIGQISDSIFVHRLFSAILTTAAVYLVYRIADQYFGYDKKFFMPNDSAPLLAAIITAISPFQIFYGQEIRMYPLLQLAILLAWVAILERRWVMLFISTVVMMWTHNYAMFYGLVLVLVYMDTLQIDKPSRLFSAIRDSWKIPAAMLAGALTVIPWLVILAGQMKILDGGYWIQPPSVGGVLEMIYMVILGFSLPEWLFSAAAIAVAGAITLAITRLLRYRPWGWVALMGMAWGPLCLALVASAVWKPVLLFRGLIVSGLAFYIVLAWALCRMRPLHRWYAASMLVPVALVGLVNYYINSPKANGTEYLAAIDRVRAEYQSGDLIVHSASASMVAWAAYAPDMPQVRLPNCGQYEAYGGLSQQTQDAMGFTQITDVPNDTNIWLIASVGPLHNGCIEAELLSKFDIVKTVYEKDDGISLQRISLVKPSTHLVNSMRREPYEKKVP